MPSPTAQDIMARSETILSPDTDIYVAMKQLLKRKLTGAPVVDEKRTLVGMLTERDCLKVLVAGAVDGLPSGTVSDYMTSPAESISPTASVYGQVSRRDTLIALESLKDNPRLYGTDDAPRDTAGVDSAMRTARGRK